MLHVYVCMYVRTYLSEASIHRKVKSPAGHPLQGLRLVSLHRVVHSSNQYMHTLVDTYVDTSTYSINTHVHTAKPQQSLHLINLPNISRNKFINTIQFQPLLSAKLTHLPQIKLLVGIVVGCIGFHCTAQTHLCMSMDTDWFAHKHKFLYS